jgi:hypothetical protein
MTKGFQADTVFEKSIVSKHVSPSGLPDTVFYRMYFNYWGGPVQLYQAMKTSFVYDSYRNPVTATQYAFNITDSVLETGYYNSSIDRIFYYHYETYQSDAVKSVTAHSERISVYPNPANDVLMISRPDAAIGTLTHVEIMNAAGRIVRTESLPWMHGTETFSIADLTPGMYVIAVKDGNGNTLYTQKIIRQ